MNQCWNIIFLAGLIDKQQLAQQLKRVGYAEKRDMDYLKFINCKKEPFARTLDPDLFSRPHQLMNCLVKIENSIRTRRGLNIILGEEGVGKTALGQQLVRRLAGFERTAFVLTGAQFNSPRDFLARLAELSGQFSPGRDADDGRFEEELRAHLAALVIDNSKTFVLIIDDGHKLPDFCFEILRRFLNRQADGTILLQVVIFADREFDKKIDVLKNVAGQISNYLNIQPLSFRETRELIQFRLHQASDEGRPASVFTFPGMWAIYKFTEGYPGKVIDLCQLVVMTMILRGRKKAGWFLVHSCARKILPAQARSFLNIRMAALVAMVIIAVAFFGQGGLQQLPVARQATDTAVDNAFEPPRQTETGPAGPGGQALKPELPETTLTAVLEEAIEKADGPGPVKGEGGPDGQVVKKTEPLPEPKPLARAESVAAKPAAAKPAAPPAPPKTAAKPKTAVETKTIARRPGAFPDILGEITAQKGETLGDMISKIYGYGSFSNKNTSRVLDVNPQIKDPGQVETGDLYRFPTFGVKAPAGADKFWWVQVATKGRLDESYRFVRANYDKDYLMFIIPTLNSQGGLQFTIVLSKAFANLPSAEKVVSRLPTALAADVIYLEGLDPERYYYDIK